MSSFECIHGMGGALVRVIMVLLVAAVMLMNDDVTPSCCSFFMCLSLFTIHVFICCLLSVCVSLRSNSSYQRW